MVEKVLIAAVRSPDRHVMMDTRLAAALVAKGTFQYVEVEEPKKKRKKGTYSRRDMTAE